MRGRIAITTLGTLLLLTLLYFYAPKPTTPQQPVTGGYPYVKPAHATFDAPVPNAPSPTPAPEKLILKAQLEGEDLNWLLKLRPQWRNQILTIDAPFARLHGGRRVDRGRVAAAYLAWIVRNYADLAGTMVFVAPAGDGQHDGLVAALQHLQTDELGRRGFVPLSCGEDTTCEPEATDELRTLEVGMAAAWAGLFNNTLLPPRIAGPGGSGFVVSKAQVLKRSVAEYTQYWVWLATTKMDDDSAGALVERLWHVIFGRPSVWCPEKEECGCAVFGGC